MQLPEKMYGTWNAADITEDVIDAGEIPLRIFGDTTSRYFPPDLLVRCFGQLSFRLHSLILTADNGDEILAKVAGVDEEKQTVTIYTLGRVSVSGSFFISEEHPPVISRPHGDVRYVLEK